MAIKFPAHAAATALARAPEAAKITALATREETTLQASLLSARRAQFSRLAKIATLPWSYHEIAASPYNAALIDSMAAATRKAMQDKGIDPGQSSMVFGLDVTGHEVSICLACGRIGHDYMPVLKRQLNPALDMIDEHIVVTNEYAKRVGFKKYSIIAVDEQMLPLREFGPPSNDGEAVLAKLRAFRERHPNIDKTVIVDRETAAWMVEAMATYNSLDASLRTTTVTTFMPADRRFIEVSKNMMSLEPGWKGLMYVKGKPSVSLKPFENLLSAAGIKAVGNAVGSNAEATAASMFKTTLVTAEMHDLRAQLGPSLVRLVQEGKAAAQDGFDRP